MQTDSRPSFVVVDFDGTLCSADVGNRFFRHFARDAATWRRLIEDWKQGRRAARECLAYECELTAVGPDEADRFFDGFALAPEAAAFAAAAGAAGAELTVASDGLDRYVRRLLAAAGLALPYRANRLHFTPQGPLPEFASAGPAVRLADGRVARAANDATPGCGRCGNCKGAWIDRARAASPGRATILIGDGYSDRCGAHAADRVYAKDDLLEYCRAQRIPAQPFENLLEVAAAEGWPAATAVPAPRGGA